MRIAEIFYSVQGEGTLAGVPSAFVRTTGCPLRCAWCDSPYTSWEPSGETMSVDESSPALSEYPTRHAVVTGGEPVVAAGIEECAPRPARSRLSHHAGDRGGRLQAACRSTWPASAPSSPRPRRTSATAAGTPCGTTSSDCGPTPSAAFLEHGPCQLKFVIDRPDDVDEIRRCWSSCRPSIRTRCC